MTSSTVLKLSSWYWIHCNERIAERESGDGKTVPGNSIISITKPTSFIPPKGSSRPSWLNVTLPYFDVQFAAGWPSLVISIAVFETCLLLTNTKPSGTFQSKFFPKMGWSPLSRRKVEQARLACGINHTNKIQKSNKIVLFFMMLIPPLPRAFSLRNPMS